MRFYATNRFNLYVSSYAEDALPKYFEDICRYNYNIVHGQPSLMMFIGHTASEEVLLRHKPAIRYFESSGETLTESYQDGIEKLYKCRCINRYGLAEFGVIAYQFNLDQRHLKLLTHSIYPIIQKLGNTERLLFTSLRNPYFPLVNYDTGDDISIKDSKELLIHFPAGRIHESISIDGIKIPSSLLMDILQHRCDGVLDFQLDLTNEPLLNIYLSNESTESTQSIKNLLLMHLGIAIPVKLVSLADFKLSGRRQKFQHIVRN